MSRLRNHLQHTLNPLHVYCRLRDMGLAAPTARRLAVRWERLVYGPVLS
jgi:hypothetical protein